MKPIFTVENQISSPQLTDEKTQLKKSFIQFDKKQLVNLQYVLSKELLRTNKNGAYASSTIIGCNTRKYHGLLVAPQPQIDNDLHVLLSSVDETVLQKESEFHLAIHKFPGGVFHPKGHKYITDFSFDPVPTWTYAVGGVLLKKEIVLLSDSDTVLIRYTLEDAQSPVRLRLMPFLAFRNYHSLSKANTYTLKKYTEVSNGVKLRLYNGYSELVMQTSRSSEYISVPDWYYNFEYSQEQERGYDFKEDLFTPGYFEFPMKKGEQVVFAAGLEEISPRRLRTLFQNETEARIPRNSFENSLVTSARQFIVQRDKKTEVVAGYHWFGRWGRDTFISLPGLTLVTQKPDLCKAVLTTMAAQMKNGLFPNMGNAYNSVDAPLWFFWALQQYCQFTGQEENVWKTFGPKMRSVLEAYKNGTDYNIHMLSNGLIYAGVPGHALTWMDAVVDGKPVTPRIGMPVEINALWYNAICFALRLAHKCDDQKFIEQWIEYPPLISASFMKAFWDEKRGYLADVVNGDDKDWSVRPNQVVVASLPFSPVDDMIKAAVLLKVQNELLTPRGLRTLSPKDPAYKGTYFGDQKARDRAYHQGTVWPWLLGHFAEGYLNVHGKNGIPFIRHLYEGFAPTLMEHGMSTISEIYDGDPPHRAEGAISQAWSVAEILRINYLINKFNKQKNSVNTEL